MTDPWRIQPTTPPSLTVLVDGRREVPIAVHDHPGDRIHYIVERLHTIQDPLDYGPIRHARQEIRVASAPPPPSFTVEFPSGWTIIGEVRVPQGAAVIHADMIG